MFSNFSPESQERVVEYFCRLDMELLYPAEELILDLGTDPNRVEVKCLIVFLK